MPLFSVAFLIWNSFFFLMLMTIRFEIRFKEYCNLLYRLAYKKPMMKVLVAVGIALVIWIAGYYFKFLPVPEPKIYQYITLTLIAVVQPLVIFYTIKRNYDSSNHLGEQLQMQFSHNKIKITGETFYTEISWQKIFKIDEQDEWFLIYQNNLSAILIPKKAFDPADIIEFKRILGTIENVPIHLNPP